MHASAGRTIHVTDLTGRLFGPAKSRMQQDRVKARPSVRGMLRAVGSMVEDTLSFFVRRVYFVVMLVLCGAVVFAALVLQDRLVNYAVPLVMELQPEQEMEILDSMMQRLALNDTDAFDENGNILKDGTALTVNELQFTQPVTYKRYTVVPGDTLLGITLKFGLTNISTLIAVNDIDNVRQLRSGQTLKIPSIDGLEYTVKKGDTLNGLSSRYKVALEELLDVNDLDSRELAAGQTLFIPGAKLSADKIRNAMGELFKYPLSSVRWRLTSRFGPRSDPFTGAKSNHTGIDMAAPTGTPIYASMGGRVITAGFSNVFGYYVVIDHGNGYQTLYGHMSKILVRAKQQVAQGSRIGLVGSTGYSTGPHLHFTVYKNGRLIDPLSVLK
jgi:murein DD-endopeptidase MepM/ murein hydrolase activator NlpD